MIERRALSAIENNNAAELRSLINDHPELLTWHDPNDDEVSLLLATTSYANFPGQENEEHWNRKQCAELLIDKGVTIDPRFCIRLVNTGAHEMLAMTERKGVLPRNLRTQAALGKLQAVKDYFSQTGGLVDEARPNSTLLSGYRGARLDWPDPNNSEYVVGDAFLYACRLGHQDVAFELLARCIEMDSTLGERIQEWLGFDGSISFLLNQAPEGARFAIPIRYADFGAGIVWQTIVELRLHQAMRADNLSEVRKLLRTEQYVLSDDFVDLQSKLLQVASYSENAIPMIETISNSGAAITTANNPPDVRAISYALEYGHADYVPLLEKIWEPPDDLPHAAGMGDLARVEKWFDGEDHLAIKDPQSHNPFPDHFPTFSVQDVLDRAFAWAVQNSEFIVADFMLEHGADLNTRWSTHEPASVLHECALAGRWPQIRYLVANGIDLSITDARYNSTAEGWARFNGNTEVADYLESLRGQT